MRYLNLILLSVFLFTACQKAPTDQTAANASSSAKRFNFKGKVVSVDRQNKRATIDHEAVEGYMDAMTMEFPIHEDWVWDDLTPGSEVRAELVVDNSPPPVDNSGKPIAKDSYWLE